MRKTKKQKNTETNINGMLLYIYVLFNVKLEI